jgi:hypothetical protein
MGRARASVVAASVAIAAALLVRGFSADDAGSATPSARPAPADRALPPDRAPGTALTQAIAPAGETRLPAAPDSGASELAPPRESSTTRLLRTYSRDELALFTRFDRLTGMASAPQLVELVRMRRAGADERALVAAATRFFRGDPLGRAAALDWARDAGRR